MPNSKKTTCESKGHIWVATPSPVIDRCARPDCHAMRRLVNEVWTEAGKQQSQPVQGPAAQQTGLWT